MELLQTKIVVKNYSDIDIRDDRYDDVEDAVISMDVTFSVSVSPVGLSFDVYEVKNIVFDYNGMVFTNDGDVPNEVNDEVTENWTKNVEVEKREEITTLGVSIDHIELDYNEKKIHIKFVY